MQARPVQPPCAALGIELVSVPAGELVMGTSAAERRRLLRLGTEPWWSRGVLSEGPDHRVEIGRSFALGAAPVTVGQFRRFIEATGYRTEGERDGTGAYCYQLGPRKWLQLPQCTWEAPGFEQTDDCPVTCVSWNDAIAFCAWLSGQRGLPYRLPTEAEWEHACRAGTTTAFAFGDALSSAQANFDGSQPHGGALPGPFMGQTTAVRSYPPNAWGLYDMHGNVFEWCADWHGERYYERSPRRDPRGPERGTLRVVRGGAWTTGAARCRSAGRKGSWAHFRINRRGFRVACDFAALRRVS